MTPVKILLVDIAQTIVIAVQASVRRSAARCMSVCWIQVGKKLVVVIQQIAVGVRPLSVAQDQ